MRGPILQSRLEECVGRVASAERDGKIVVFSQILCLDEENLLLEPSSTVNCYGIFRLGENAGIPTNES